MIVLNITKSPDLDSKGTFSSPKRKITIGLSIDCDLYLRDKKISKFHLVLHSLPEGVAITTLNLNDFYLSNGKKISGKKIHQIGDIITIGDSEFSLAEHQHLPNSKESLEHYYEDVANNHQDLLPLLEAIEVEIVKLEEALTK